jgi:hypothetical protein
VPASITLSRARYSVPGNWTPSTPTFWADPFLRGIKFGKYARWLAGFIPI